MTAHALSRPADILVTELADLISRASEVAEASRAANTLRVYGSAWRAFVGWCEARLLVPLPAHAGAVVAYLVARVEGCMLASCKRRPAKIPTLELSLAAIAHEHRRAGQADPTEDPRVSEVMRGYRRRLGVAPSPKKAAVIETLREALHARPRDLLGLRDRALLTVGWAGAFRRTELVALDVADLEFTTAGLRIQVRRSKVDQEGQGAVVGLPYGSDPQTCPVRTVNEWLGQSGISQGAVFRGVNRGGRLCSERLSPEGVLRAVRRAVQAIGHEPAVYGGHSLRRGLATTAARCRKSLGAIMKQGRWKSETTVRGYIEEAALFDDDTAAWGVGL